MPNITKEQINRLPEDVRDCLLSIKGDEIVALIAEKYKIGQDKVFLLAELIRKVYIKAIKPVDLPVATARLFNLKEDIAYKMACDIAGARLLIVSDWLGEDIEKLIISWGGNPVTYAPHVNAQKTAIVKERQFFAEQSINPYRSFDFENNLGDLDETEELTTDELYEHYKIVFKENVLNHLMSEDTLILKEFNSDLGKILLEKGYESKTQLSSALFLNQEKISDNSIVLDGRLVESTIGHWLEYFVRQKGSGITDAVAASDFVANSDNAKTIEIETKELLIKLLALYRNVKFFPDSQPSQNPEDWQFFPIPEIETTIVRNVAPAEYARPANKPLTNMSSVQTSFKENTIPVFDDNKPTSENKIQSDNQKQINEALRLQKMLSEYPVGSLEYLAIEEELKQYTKNTL
ncbi:MAG: hypothetical protein PHR00_04570 [Patescibacteria group bacterium]|nr:hypothetical protein [Patescibacteria group bacterium]